MTNAKPKINLSKLMKDLYSLGYERPEVEAIFLAVHGGEDNGKTYDAE
jgi:hypothetical protein